MIFILGDDSDTFRMIGEAVAEFDMEATFLIEPSDAQDIGEPMGCIVAADRWAETSPPWQQRWPHLAFNSLVVGTGARGAAELGSGYPMVLSTPMDRPDLIACLSELCGGSLRRVVSLQAGEVFLERGEMVHGEEVVRLAPKEVALLGFLVARPGLTVPKAILLSTIWGPGAGVRTLYSTMNRLRQKVERDRDVPDHLMNRRGGGYVFEPIPRWDGWRNTAELVGRQRELDDLIARMDRGARLVTVCGGEGVGKTAVVEALVSLVSRRLWARSLVVHRLHRWLGASGLVREVAQTVGISIGGCTDETEAAEQVGEVLSHRHEGMLVVVDDAVGTPELVRVLRCWLRKVPEMRIVVGTRERLHVVGEQSVMIEPLVQTAAERFLPSGDHATDWVHWADGNARALSIIASILAEDPSAAAPDRPQSDTIGVAIQELLRRLPPFRARALIQAASFAVAPPRAWMERVVEVSEPGLESEQVFDGLAASGVLSIWDRDLRARLGHRLDDDPDGAETRQRHETVIVELARTGKASSHPMELAAELLRILGRAVADRDALVVEVVTLLDRLIGDDMPRAIRERWWSTAVEAASSLGEGASVRVRVDADLALGFVNR